MKVALLGGGGFRAPMVVDALERSTAGMVDGVVLHDLDDDRLERIAAVVEGSARERGDGLSVRTTTRMEEAVDGAGFVFVAIRVGGLEARAIDERVALEEGVLGQETVGPGGIAFALRTIPVVRELAEVVAAVTPDAWVVNFTNPAGLVTEVLRETLGARAVGICDSPTALCRHVAAAVDPADGAPSFDYVGLNHLGWLTAARAGHRDVLTPLLADDARLVRVYEARLFGLEAVRALGVLPNEYLVYYRRADDVIAELRRGGSRSEILQAQQAAFYAAAPPSSPAEALARWRRVRDARHDTYLAEARPTDAEAIDDDHIESIGYGDVAAAFVRAVTADDTSPAEIVLEVPNAGAVDWLDDDATIEVPCRVDGRGPVGRAGASPPANQRELAVRVRETERLTIAAASSRSLDAVVGAIAAHPLVPSRRIAERIARGYLARHGWMRERYA